MRYGSPAHALRITLCNMPCAANGCSHENALSMRRGCAVAVDEEILGRVHVAERAGVERAVRLARLAGTIRRRRRFRIRRLVAETAGRVDRAEQHLQEMQRAARVESVRMRRDAAHRVHRDRAADHFGVLAAVRVGPALRQADLLVERGFGELAREAADRVGGDAAGFRDRVGRVFVGEVAFGEELECGNRRAAVGQRVFADDERRDVGDRDSVDDTNHALHRRSQAGERAAHRARFRPRRARSIHRPPRPAHESPDDAHWCSARDSRDRSRSVRNSSWISAPASKPSVPGLIGTHSSAIAP